MTRKFFYIFSFFIILVLSLITILSVLLQDLKYYTELTFGLIEKRTGFRVTIDDINLAFPKGAGLKVENLAIFDPETGDNIFRSERVYLLTEITPLLKKKFMITKVFFQKPEMSLFLDKDRNIFLSRIPITELQPVSSYETSSGISFHLKNLLVENAVVDFTDTTLPGLTRLEKINITATQNKLGEYETVFSAKSPIDSTAEDVSLHGNILLPEVITSFRDISGEVNILFKDIMAKQYIRYLPRDFTTVEENSVLNGKINISKQKAEEITIAGSINSEIFSLQTDKTGVFDIAPFEINFETYFNEATLRIDRLEAIFPNKTTITGNGEIKTDPLFIDMKLSSGIMDINKISQYIKPAIKNHTEIQGIFEKIKSGNIQIKELIYSGSPAKPPSHFNVFILTDNVSVEIDQRLPLLQISEGFINVANSGLDTHMTANLFRGDHHIIKASAVSLFDKTEIKADIQSSIPSDSLLKTVSDFQQKDPPIKTTGEITAQTSLHFNLEAEKALEVSSSLDLENTRFEIGEALFKDKGIPVNLNLKKAFASGDSVKPLLFDIRSSEYLSLTGTVLSFSPFAAEGEYSINELPMSLFAYPFIPAEFTADGVFSGAGTFSFPFQNISVAPLKGSLFIKDFSVKETDSEERFAYSNMSLEIDSDSVSINRSYVKFGETSLFLDGTLTDINPIEGNITISGKHIDIGNFTDTINNINQQIRKKEVTGRARKFFGSLNIKSDITTETLRFKKWRGGNSLSDFMFENGVMLWDNITINTADGFLKGSIMYDFSSLPLQTLSFDITESNVDTAWAIPELKKAETMTGRLHLTGTVRSDFPKGARIIPRMTGELSVAIKQGKLLRFTILSKILSLINLPRLFQMEIPDPLSKGMPFDSITADLKVEEGVFSTDDFMLKSPAMNLSATGNIDTVNETINFISGVQILPAITKLIGNIPIAGNILLGDEGTITAGYFQISGNLYNPAVKPMPIKSINRAVVNTLENIFSIPMRILSPIFLFRDNGSNNKDAPEEKEQ